MNTRLTQAVALALTGSALSLGAVSNASAAATTMYNLTTGGAADNSAPSATPCAPCGTGATDGWVWDFSGTPLGSTNSVAKWAGTAGANTTPFGYNGGAVLHWAVRFTAAGDTAEISSQDAVNRYGIPADVDTAKSAWSDAAIGGASGWRHDLDVGLFKSDTTGQVTLSASGILQTGTQFGFTIFKGMDTVSDYNHHGGWNSGNNTASSLPGGVNAGTGFTTADVVAYSVGGATPSNLNTISFNAVAGQIYTIFLGGYGNGSWGDTTDGYSLTVSQVPVPAAIWLFGSALAGMGVIGRRRSNLFAT